MFTRFATILPVALLLTSGCMEDGPEQFQTEQFGIEVYPSSSPDYDYDAYITDLYYNEPVGVDEMAQRLYDDEQASLSTEPDPDLQSVTQPQYSPRLSFGVDYHGLFYIHFRGFGRDTGYHPLTPCVSEKVKHVHITIKQSKSTSDDLAWSALHIGTYTSAATGEQCAVLYDSKNKSICERSCPPDWDTVQRDLQDLMFSTVTKFVSFSVAVAAAVAYIVNYIGMFALVAV